MANLEKVRDSFIVLKISKNFSVLIFFSLKQKHIFFCRHKPLMMELGKEEIFLNFL